MIMITMLKMKIITIMKNHEHDKNDDNDRKMLEIMNFTSIKFMKMKKIILKI